MRALGLLPLLMAGVVSPSRSPSIHDLTERDFDDDHSLTLELTTSHVRDWSDFDPPEARSGPIFVPMRHEANGKADPKKKAARKRQQAARRRNRR